ncbi:hypothetical protein R80B4_02579 [Fibrobacteres bacterium R8-0-B4]
MNTWLVVTFVPPTAVVYHPSNVLPLFSGVGNVAESLPSVPVVAVAGVTDPPTGSSVIVYICVCVVSPPPGGVASSFCRKFAVTVLSLSIKINTVVLVLTVSPVHPVNVQPSSGVAVTGTDIPEL